MKPCVSLPRSEAFWKRSLNLHLRPLIVPLARTGVMIAKPEGQQRWLMETHLTVRSAEKPWSSNGR